ncbi:hypothetical protein Agub_g11230, partial [Astrephomene gubernaculifera]
MMLHFEATGAGHPPDAPSTFNLPLTTHLPKANLLKALSVVPAPGTVEGVQVILLARNATAWCQRASGECVSLSRGVGVFVGVGDEVVFGDAGAPAPPDEPDVAYLLCASEGDAQLGMQSLAAAGFQASETFLALDGPRASCQDVVPPPPAGHLATAGRPPALASSQDGGNPAPSLLLTHIKGEPPASAEAPLGPLEPASMPPSTSSLQQQQQEGQLPSASASITLPQQQAQPQHQHQAPSPIITPGAPAGALQTPVIATTEAAGPSRPVAFAAPPPPAVAAPAVAAAAPDTEMMAVEGFDHPRAEESPMDASMVEAVQADTVQQPETDPGSGIEAGVVQPAEEAATLSAKPSSDHPPAAPGSGAPSESAVVQHDDSDVVQEPQQEQQEGPVPPSHKSKTSDGQPDAQAECEAIIGS